MKKVQITQSNYIPWKGFFDNISRCDVTVLYDDMQYTRRDWRNRNYIKTPQGLKWLSIPVRAKGNFHARINQMEVSDLNWNKNHWAQLKEHYSKAPYFAEYSSWIKDLYDTATYKHLSEINIHFLKAICQFLEIKTEFIESREFDLIEGKTERLIQICRELNATDYYTGPAARQYMEIELFDANNINVHFYDYSGYPEYSQLYPPFEHGVSILDMIFNLGPRTKDFLKFDL